MALDKRARWGSFTNKCTCSGIDHVTGDNKAIAQADPLQRIFKECSDK